MPIGKLCPGFKLLVERRAPRPSQSLSRLRMVGLTGQSWCPRRL